MPVSLCYKKAVHDTPEGIILDLLTAVFLSHSHFGVTLRYPKPVAVQSASLMPLDYFIYVSITT